MASVKLEHHGSMSGVLRQIGANLKTAKVRVGIFSNATTDDGKLIAEYATYNEFGTSRIPARPFMRTTMQNHSAEWQNTFAHMIKGQAEDPTAVDKALRMVGTQAVGHVRETIKSNLPPPNAESTRRKKTKVITGAKGRPMRDGNGDVVTYAPGTLIDTGAMIQAIAFEVNPE